MQKEEKIGRKSCGRARGGEKKGERGRASKINALQAAKNQRIDHVRTQYTCQRNTRHGQRGRKKIQYDNCNMKY